MTNINADAVQHAQRMLKCIQWVVDNLQDSPKSFMQNVMEIMQGYPAIAANITGVEQGSVEPASKSTAINPNRYKVHSGATLVTLEVKVKLDMVPGAWHEVSDFHQWLFQNYYVQEVSEKGRSVVTYNFDIGGFEEKPV